VNSRVGRGNPLAKLLAESGIVSQRELGEAARSKVERILSDLLTYEQGSYEFEDGVLPKGAVDLKLSTERLMLAAARRVEERAFVLRHVESLQSVLAPLASGDAAAEELRSEIGELLDQFDGQQTLKEVATAAGTEDFDTARVACALLFLGVLQPAADAATMISAGSAWAEPEPEGGEIDLGAEAEEGFAGEAPLVEPEPSFQFGSEADDADATMAIPTPDFSDPGAFGASPEPAFEVDAGTELGWQPAAEPEPEAAPEPQPGWEAESQEPEATWQPQPDAEPEPEPEPTWQPEAEDEAEDEPEPEAELGWQPQPEADPEPAWQPPTGFDASPPPPTISETRPPAARPSREDLAALDALLNNRTVEEGPLEPLEKPTDADWKPQFLPGGVTRPPRGRAHPPARSGSSNSSKAVPVLAAVVVVLAAVGGGVFYLGGIDAAMARLQSLRPGETQVTEVPPAPEPVTQPPLEAPSPDAESPVATPEGGGETPAPPAATPTPEPAPPTPAPTPAATPTPAPPAPATPASGSTPPSVDAARAALRGGRFADAGRGFATQLRGVAPWTVQVLVACSTETLDKAVKAVDAPELYVLPVTLQGRACFRLCWGLFASEAQAGEATSQVPRYFIENGARPRVVRSETLF